MHLRSILAMAVLVGLLALFLFLRDPNAGAPRPPELLFPGVGQRDVVALRVDHLARGYQLQLERDAAGRWAVVDPIAYPAESAHVALLLEAVVNSAGLPQDIEDPAAIGLDPPRAVFEMTWERDGVRASRAIELGALDTDSNRVWVRVEGQPMLTLSSIETALAGGVPAFRSKQVAEFQLRRVLAFRRSGRLVPHPGEPERELDFSGLREDRAVAWRSESPSQTWLAGESVTTFLGALRALRVNRFYDDSLDPLAVYGLEEPALRIELSMAGGETHAWRFALEDPALAETAALVDQPWLCHREGFPFVWRVNGAPLRILAATAPSFYDYGLARGSRELFDRFEIAREPRSGRATQFVAEREGEAWSLIVEEGEGVPAETVPGDSARILDALFGVQSTVLLVPLEGTAFRWDEELRRYALSIEGELEWSGRVGSEHTTADGLVGRLVQRDDDGLVYLGPPELWDALDVERATLESRTAAQVTELELVSLEVRTPACARRYLRDDRGRWELETDPGREARELWDLMDVATSLGVERWLPAGAPLAEPVELRFVDRDGELVELVLGRVEHERSPRVAIEVDGRRGLLPAGAESELHGQLLALCR